MKKILLFIALSTFPFFLLFLYDRLQVLFLIFKNDPERLRYISEFGSYEIKFEDKVRNCEDALLLEEEGVAILSCDPSREQWNTVLGIDLPGPAERGGLWIYDYASGEANLDSIVEVELVGYAESEVHPLGIAYYRPSSTLFVVNHMRDGSRIDVFDLRLGKNHSITPRATHKRYIKHPLLHTPNSLALINEQEAYATNDHFFLASKHRNLATLEDYIAAPSGSVVHIDLRTDSVRNVARIPYANGVEFLNATTLVVASTNKAAVYFLSVDSETRDLTYQSRLQVPFLVDNLAVDRNDALLIAGHPHPYSLRRFAKSRAFCNSGERNSDFCSTVSTGSWVAEWTEKRGRRDLYMSTEFPTSCTAVRDTSKGIGIVTGLYARGVLVWRD